MRLFTSTRVFLEFIPGVLLVHLELDGRYSLLLVQICYKRVKIEYTGTRGVSQYLTHQIQPDGKLVEWGVFEERSNHHQQ